MSMSMSMDMPMSSGTMSMPVSTSILPSSATATSSSAMQPMSTMSGNGMMGMSSMMMVFFTSTSTPLFSKAWTPGTTGQYAGTCVFLIALSAVLRGLVALRVNFAGLWGAWAVRNSTDSLAKPAIDAYPQPRRPWRINEAATRAILDVSLAGVSYLLMLAVMTMNVGYFLSVLGGVFLGSFTLGGWTFHSVMH